MSEKKFKFTKLTESKAVLAGSSFFIGLIIGYLLGFFRIHNLFTMPKVSGVLSWLRWFGEITPDATFLSDIAAIEAVLIGVSIPIALQVVSWSADRYSDQEIAKFFTEELLYRLQYILLLSNIVLVLLLKFLAIKNLLILWIIFLWFVANVIIFYLFIRLVERYATEIDNLLLNKLRNHVQNILEK